MWTNTAPTKPGWYWYRYVFEEPRVMQAYEDSPQEGMRYIVTRNQDTFSAAQLSCEFFSEAISPPE